MATQIAVLLGSLSLLGQMILPAINQFPGFIIPQSVGPNHSNCLTVNAILHDVWLLLLHLTYVS